MKTTTKKTTALVFTAAALALGAGLALAPGAVLAQQPPPAQRDCGCHGRGPDGEHAQRSPAERLAHWQEMLGRVSRRLQLDARQIAEAQRILQDTSARVEQLRATTAERTPERHAGRQAMMQAADARFTAILTPPQRVAWAALKAELQLRHGRGGERGRHGGPGREGGRGRGEGAPFGQRTEAQRGI